jgi:hypothetical protein
MSMLRLPLPVRLVLALALGSGLAGAVHANPCASDDVPTTATAERQPLQRPYVLKGLAATATQQRGGERWLELAVDSPATVARVLGTRPALRLEQDASGRVLLACSSLDGSAIPLRSAALTQALW